MQGVSLGQVLVRGATDKALRVFIIDSDEEIWIPKSVIHDDSEVYSEKSGDGEMIVMAWWAKANGYGDGT